MIATLLIKRRNQKMKNSRSIITMFAVALTFAPQFVNSSSAASDKYSAQLISPTAGQVLYPGQQVMVKWNATIPKTTRVGARWRFGCRWMAAGASPCASRRTSIRGQDISIGLFRTRLPTQRSWTFVSGVNGITPKATAPSLLRLL